MDIKLHLSDLNATQLARLYVTLRELGRFEEAAEVNKEGIVNCGFVDFLDECRMVRAASMSVDEVAA